MMFNHRHSWNVVSWITALYLCNAGSAVIAQSTEIPLGSITTRMHNAAGEVFLLSDRVLEVRGFVYDGEAPAVYFWADTNAVPSASGFRLNDGSPNNGCGVTSLPQEADGTVTYRVEFPDNSNIFDILGGSISLWCEDFSVSFGEVIIPTSLDNVPTTSSGPDLECSANIEETPVAAPTAATTPIAAPVASPIAATAPIDAPEASPIASPTAATVPVDAPEAAPTAATAPVDAPEAAPTAATAPVTSPTSVTVPAPTASTDGAPYLLGNLTTRAHNVSGVVYLVSDHIFEIRGFTYDGEGPAAYFYIDTAVEPTADGLSLLDSEGVSAPSCGMAPLVAADGTDVYRAEFPNGTSVQEYLGGSFSVWCTVAAANFGEIIIPTTLPDSVSAVDDSSLLVCATPMSEETEPFFIGNLTTRAHNVSGAVYLISDHIVEIRGFMYDGEGPAAYFYIDAAVEPTADGLSLLDSEGGSAPSCGMAPLVAADGTDVYRAEFPNETSIQEYLGGSFSVWCTVAAANFGEVVIPTTLPDSVSAVDDSSLLACATPMFEETEPFLIGNLTTRAHNVSGTVYLISDHIIEIKGFNYDGEGPAAYFYMDTAAEPTANGLSLLDSEGGSTPSCGMAPLLAANGTDIYRAEFPSGTSIQDFLGGSFSVWCTVATANFGEVVIPSSIPDSVTAVDDSSLLVCANPPSEESESLLIGSLTSRAHNVTGTVYLISDHIIEIKGFTYDGEGPAAYFYIDTAAEPTANGLTLLDSEGGTEPSCGMVPLLAADGTDVYRAEFPSGTSIQDYLGGSFSVWCRTAAANFGEVVIPSTLPESVSAVDDSSLLICVADAGVPAFVATPDGYNCETLSESFQVRWLVEGDFISVELIGIVDEEDYMSFGVSGKNDETFMIDGDIVVADSFEGTYRARDFYMNSRSQCSDGTGVCPDTDSDGAVDDVNATSISGDREQGVTVIRYQKNLVPSDVFGIDSPISVLAGEVTFVNWALGPLNPETGNPQFHLLYPRTNVSIEFGRDTVDNCAPIINGTVATETPSTSFEIPMIQDVTEFVANIGPSGGDRGYKGITGQISWGIAWYVNDLLAPVIEMKRGTTYTFTAYGGDDASNGAEYHPFYITSSPFGGYQQINATERAKETVYAGVENIVLGDGGSVLNFTSPFVAPICLYVTTDASDEAAMTGTYPQFFETLDTSCKNNAAIVDNGATFTFTPNATTPDLLFYHCVTHRNLGWKIMIVDADDSSPVAAPTTSDSSSLSLGYLVVTSTIICSFFCL